MLGCGRAGSACVVQHESTLDFVAWQLRSHDLMCVCCQRTRAPAFKLARGAVQHASEALAVVCVAAAGMAADDVGVVGIVGVVAVVVGL